MARSKEPACNAEAAGSIPGSGDPLEEGMATQPSICAWSIPWTEELGGLQAMGSPRGQTQMSSYTRPEV